MASSFHGNARHAPRWQKTLCMCRRRFWAGSFEMTGDMKRKPDLSNDLDLLLDDLCREWGFCNRLTAADLLAQEAPLSANEFARAVLRAEGMNSELETSWMRRIQKR